MQIAPRSIKNSKNLHELTTTMREINYGPYF